MTLPGRPEVYLCHPGAATHLPTVEGASDYVDSVCDVVGVSGASAGAAVAVKRAFGIDATSFQRLVQPALEDNNLLDPAPFELGDLGICGGHAIPRLVDALLGKDARMGDAIIPLVVAVTRVGGGALYLSKRFTPRVLVREALRASMGFPIVFPQVRIPSFDESPQLYTDGGVADNTVDAVFDHLPRPRYAIRLQGGGAPPPVRAGNTLSQAFGLIASLARGAQGLKSKRTDGRVVDVRAIGSGLDFSLTKDQYLLRYRTGFQGAKDALQ